MALKVTGKSSADRESEFRWISEGEINFANFLRLLKVKVKGNSESEGDEECVFECSLGNPSHLSVALECQWFICLPWRYDSLNEKLKDELNDCENPCQDRRDLPHSTTKARLAAELKERNEADVENQE